MSENLGSNLCLMMSSILQKKHPEIFRVFFFVLRRIEDTIIFFRNFLTFIPLRKYFVERIDEKKILKTCGELVESKNLSNSDLVYSFEDGKKLKIPSEIPPPLCFDFLIVMVM